MIKVNLNDEEQAKFTTKVILGEQEKIKLVLIELANGDIMLVDILDIAGFYIKKGVCCIKDCDNSDCYIDGDFSVCEYCQHNGYALQIMLDNGQNHTVKLYEHQGDALDGLSLLKNQIYGIKNHEIQEVILQR